jgi:predicted RNA-binding Zn-ribbon protein involved in translation (DUF1610 family)
MASDDESDTTEDDDSLPEIDEEAIKKLDEAIIAAEDAEVSFFLVCPNCGGRDLGVIPADPVAAASTVSLWESQYLCRACGHEGVPLIFDDEEVYQKFRESKGGSIDVVVGT